MASRKIKEEILTKKEQEEREEKIRELARQQHHVDGEVEVDDGGIVSEGDDNGAYVQAWVWVDYAGTDLDKESEEK